MKKNILIGVIVLLAVSFFITINDHSTTTSTTDTESKTVIQEPKVITMEKFLQLKEGMSYTDVVSIIGEEGDLSSSSEIAGYKTVLYTWKGTSLGSNMIATFQNDKMVSKSQFGLK